MRCLLKLAAVLLVLANLLGCASSGVVRNASPISTTAPVALDFVLVETSSAVKDLESEKQLLNELIMTGLKQTEVFGIVSGNPADASSRSGLKVQAEIQEIKRVSDDARVWAGALAGRARILIRVSVSDLSSGGQIEAFGAEGKSGKSANAGTTNEAIQRVADQVVAEMVKISMQTSQ